MQSLNHPTDDQRTQVRPQKEGLIRYLMFFALGLPAFGAIMIAGYLLLFVIGLASGTQQPQYALLLTAFGTLVAVMLALPTRKMLERGEISQSTLRYAIGFGVFFLFLNIAWQNFVIISIVGVWLPVAMLFAFLESRRQVITLAIIATVFTALLLLVNRYRPIEPASVLEPGALAAILLTMSVVVAFVSIAVITNVLRFRTVAGRLTVTFVTVTLLPAVTTMIILSVQSYTHDRQLIFEVMDSIATQKVQQIEHDVDLVSADLDRVLADRRGEQIMAGLLSAPPAIRGATTYYQDAEQYFPVVLENSRLAQEVLLLDLSGEAVYSTSPDHRFATFDGEPFFRQGLFNTYSSTVTNSPYFGAKSFVSTSPVRVDGKTIGEIVFVSNFSDFERIVSTPSGAREEGETYLISEEFLPLTSTRESTFAVRSEAAVNALNGHQSGDGTYKNYAGQTVLGSYHWVPALRAGLVTEQTRLQSLLPTVFLIGNILIIGLFAIAMSVVAVIFTSRSITAPIEALADAARLVSEGKFTTRADASRPDELGTLAESFNFMAATLQEIVANLETRVDERTHDLQSQALRLRAAAEITRDSASAVSLQDLLTRSVELISERFGYYHVSIYLLDSNRENLVLSAASGDAGGLMLETGYKVRGGETIVADVAQTGTARSVSDLSRERPGLRHALLPGSRSELGMPLKSHNVLIGVLDVHSDQAGAFTEDDLAVLQLMADQLSVAIERTRILQESEGHLRELERNYQRATRESLRTLLRSRAGDMIGYAYEGADVKPLTEVPVTTREALERGEPVLLHKTDGAGRGTVMAVPIKLRGTTIGAFNLTVKDNAIPAETADLAQDISERLAQALEASWLLNESRARAERERFISEMSAKIGAAPDVERILRTTVEELSSVVGDSPITIRLRPSKAGGERGQE